MRRHVAALYALVIVGGVLGSLARFGVSETWGTTALWPWPTFTVNVTGAVFIGFALETIVSRGWPAARRDQARAFAITGVLGGFTTFSALSEETVRLADAHAGLAAGYVLASLACGVLGVLLGEALGRLAGGAASAQERVVAEDEG